jgi:transposase
MQPLNGNSEDKAPFKQGVEAHLEPLLQATPLEYRVAESALYTQATLQSLGARKWITRVPATLKEAQRVLAATPSEPMNVLDEDYRYRELVSTYAGIEQRGWLIESTPARQRALKIVNHQVLKGSGKEAQAFQRLCQQTFACSSDAQQAFEQFQATLKFTTVEGGAVEALPAYDKPGRPATGQPPTTVRFRLSGALASAPQTREALLTRKSRFIVATNELDAHPLPPAERLAAYKQQSQVERGFRFMKDPLFLASSLFLKSPQRIMALMRVMTLSLLVYAALEYRMRQTLAQHQQTFPDQKGQPTSKPTARWVFQCFVGIHVLIVRQSQTPIPNLHDHHRGLLALLGPP